VIDVRVREQDVADGERVLVGEGQQGRHLSARIDQHGLAGVVAPDDEAVLEERADGLGVDYDHDVILAILDDLMFTSKIKTAANQLGVAVTFARSPEAALSEMRKRAPSLVIFDLNNPRTDPLGTVGAMKGDPALASIPTIGFASHVQIDVIDAARKAGVDEVLARSAFTARLGEILTRRI
jgi:PleD family two-component response regulator